MRRTLLIGLGLAFLAVGAARSSTLQPIIIPKRTFKTFQILPAEVSYDGASYHQILNDDGSGGFLAPQWKDNSNPPNGTATDPGDFRFPISYTGGTPISLSAKFFIKPQPPAGTDIRIRATGPGFDLPPQAATILTGQLQYPESQATAALAQGVGYMNSMVLNWQASTDGGTTWKKIGQTGNRLYITLADPTASARLYQTVMHLATSNGNATTAAGAAANTWALFAGPANVKTWDGRLLFYYEPGQGFTACETDSGPLLKSPTGSGQCGSFAHLLIDALGANGIASSFIGIQSTTDQKFLVKNWSFSSTPSFQAVTPDHPWEMVLSEGGGGMVPPLANDVYGDLTSLAGLPGQNTNTPSEKVFDFHFIVQQGSNFYDPSYGVTYGGPIPFQSAAVSGFATHVNGDANDVWHVRKTTTTTDVRFFLIQTYQ